MRRIKFRAFCQTVAIRAWTSVSGALQSKGAAPAPVPPQIGVAQTVFLTNAGGESLATVTDQTVFDGGPDRPYNDFYASMKSWGRFQIVSSAASADLVFEISRVLSDTGLKLPVLLLGNGDKNFVSALNAILSRMKLLASQAPAPAQWVGASRQARACPPGERSALRRRSDA
jgi:hypothetical protein